MPLTDFVACYEAAGGGPIDPETLLFYRLFGEIKHAVISLTAARSFADGRTRNLQHADRMTLVPACLKQFLRVAAGMSAKPTEAQLLDGVVATAGDGRTAGTGARIGGEAAAARRDRHLAPARFRRAAACRDRGRGQRGHGRRRSREILPWSNAHHGQRIDDPVVKLLAVADGRSGDGLVRRQLADNPGRCMTRFMLEGGRRNRAHRATSLLSGST